MNPTQLFIIRLVLSFMVAALLMRIFYPAAHFVYTIVLAAVLLGLAYLSAQFRKRKTRGE